MALHGVDLSHHNSDLVFLSCLEEEDFIILKASEGKTYQDPSFAGRQNVLVQKGIRRGYYHYARPENNTPEEEVENFLRTIGTDAKNAILVLDWEGNALKHDFYKWAVRWLSLVRLRISPEVSPLLYASASVIRAQKIMLSEHEIPVWTAHYDDSCANGCIHDGGINEILTQYTSKGVDRNIFHGTRWEDYTANGAFAVTTEKKIVAAWTDDNYEYEVTRIKKG